MEINSPALARRPARRQPRLAMRCWLRSCPQASPGLPCAWESGSGEQPLKCEPQSKCGPYEREKKERSCTHPTAFAHFPALRWWFVLGEKGVGKGWLCLQVWFPTLIYPRTWTAHLLPPTLPKTSSYISVAGFSHALKFFLGGKRKGSAPSKGKYLWQISPEILVQLLTMHHV